MEVISIIDQEESNKLENFLGWLCIMEAPFNRGVPQKADGSSW